MKTAQTANASKRSVLITEGNESKLLLMIPETEVNVGVACRNNGPDLQQEVETLRREVAALRLQHHLVGVPWPHFS